MAHANRMQQGQAKSTRYIWAGRLKLAAAVPAALLWAAAAAVASHPKPLLQDDVQMPEPHERTHLRVNPPTFRWPLVEGARSYELQLSRSANFEKPLSVSVTTTFYRPLKPLEAGSWHWRVRAAGSAWTASSFRLDAKLPKWEAPSAEAALARIPKARPRIYIRPEQVSQYRAGAAGPMRAFVKDWAASMERYIGEKAGGRRKADAEPAPSSGDEKEDRLRKQKVKTWAAKAASHELMTPVADLAWLAMLTGDDRFGAEARRRVMTAAALDPEKDLDYRTSDFANANVVARSAVAYDMLHDRFTPAERAAVRKMLVARTEPIFKQLRRSPNKLFGAHPWQHIFAQAMMGALALYGEEPVAEQWLKDGVETFVALYPWYGGLAGGSAEGVNYYTCCEMLTSMEARDIFDAAFGIDFARDNPWFRANPFYLIYAIPPGGIRSLFGDVNPDRLRETPIPQHHLAAVRYASLYDNGYAADYARRVPDNEKEDRLERFRWSPFKTVAPVSIEKLPAARAFEDIGMVFMHSAIARREENVRLEFRSSPYGAVGHSHGDQNSFSIIAFNEPLLIDSGYYTSAGDRHHAGWTRQSKAHNTVLVDGKGQAREGPRNYGEIAHFEQTAEWVYTVGKAAPAYADVDVERFDRHVLWLRGRDVQTYIILDDLASGDGQSHRFDWLLHSAQRMQVDDARAAVTVRNAAAVAKVAVLEPAGVKITQTDRFDPPAENWRNRKNDLPNQWHLTVAAPAARTLRYLVVIQVGRPGLAAAPVEKIADGVRVAGRSVTFSGGRLRVAE